MGIRIPPGVPIYKGEIVANLIKTAEMIDTLCVNGVAIGKISDYSIDINHDDREIDVRVVNAIPPVKFIRGTFTVNKKDVHFE